MPEIDSLNTSFYYSGLQNTQNQAIKNKKTEKTDSKNKIRFSSLLKKQEDVNPVNSLPPEILKMDFDTAVTYLADQVNLSGNDLSENVSEENIQKFKSSVANFVKFVVDSNYKVNTRRSRVKKFHSPVSIFSTYNTTPVPVNPKVQIEIINKKLDEFVQDTLERQKNNLKILQTANEIKGLIVDLMSS